MEYYNAERSGFNIMKFLNINAETRFSLEGICPSKEGGELVDFKEGIPRGRYLLINETEPTDAFPTICAYRQLE